MVLKKLLGVLIVVSLLLSGVTSFAQTTGGAQGLGISPAIQEVEAEPGKAYDIDYLAENNTGVDKLVVDVGIETFEEGSIPGSANVVPFKEDRNLSYWLTVPSQQTFANLEKKKLTYQLTIPQNTAPGAYFFAIVYQPQTTGTQKVGGGNSVYLKTRIATLLFVNIGGDASKQPQIEKYTITPEWVDPLFDHVNINYDVKLKGNSFYRPVGNIFLSDNGSDSIVTLSSFVSDKLILPNGVRSYGYCVNSSVVLKNTCSQTELDGKLPIIGTRTVTLRLDYNDGSGNPQTVVADKSIIIFPYKATLIVLGIGILWLVLYALIVRIKRNKYDAKPTE